MIYKHFVVTLFLIFCLPGVSSSQEMGLYDTAQWKDISEFIPTATLDIRYASTENFTNTQIYDCPACFLRKKAAIALKKVSQELEKDGYSLIIYDCYRPAAYQQRLWNVVPNPNYVAPPAKGSVHSRGLAIDLSIIDNTGKPLDMGTDHDHFGAEAHQDYTDLPEIILKNRTLLKNIMEKYGFSPIRTEWWHYNYGDNAPLESVLWNCDTE